MQRSEKLCAAAGLLIDISKEVQLNVREEFDSLSSLKFAKEFCTVRCATSRRGGHDWACTRISKLFDGVIYISNSLSQAAIFKRELLDYDIGNKNVKVTNLNSLQRDLYRIQGRKIEAVIVNPAACFKTADLDMIYRSTLPFLVSNQAYFYILIG